MKRLTQRLARLFGRHPTPRADHRPRLRPLVAESLEQRMLLSADLVRMRMEITDPFGQSVTTADEGDSLDVRVYLQDIRNDPEANAGLFAAYLDLDFDEQVLSNQGTFTRFSPYQGPFNGDWVFEPGQIQNAGGILSQLVFAGSNEYQMFKVPFTVASPPLSAVNDDTSTDPSLLINAGQLPHVFDILANDVLGGPTQVLGGPATGAAFEVILQDPVDLDPPNRDYKYPDPVPPENVDYGQATINVNPNGTLFISNAGPTSDPAASFLSDKGGTLQVIGGGQQISYTPPASMDNLAAGETDTDTFSYVVSNGTGGTDTGTVTVTITGSSATRFDLTIRPVRTQVTPDTGETSQLPPSREWLDEWDTYWVEVWVSTPLTDNVGVASASFDLSYDTTYHTAVANVQYGPGFTPSGQYTIDDANGQVLNIAGTTSTNDVGDDAFALLARVPFVRRPFDAEVPLIADGQYMTAVAQLTTELSNYDLDLIGQGGDLGIGTGGPLTVDLWPVMYDLDDNQIISFSDFSFFSSVFLSQVRPGDSSYAADFDHSGRVDFADFSFFSANFGSGPSGARIYPPGFPEDWEGQPLSVLAAGPPLGEPETLSEEQLAPVVDGAVARLAQAAGDSGAALDEVVFEIVDLPGDLLGLAHHDRVQLDVDAAGYGWFVDTTPGDDVEFAAGGSAFELSATADSASAGRVDLLTVVAHELAHLLGHDDDDGHRLMESLLPAGTRRMVDLFAGGTHDSLAQDLISGPPVDPATLDHVFALDDEA